ncbi:MAG: phosphate ABC transporter substrate-binding protein [candidate division Zixibacteria bacterium]|nr:phosphate ABC transporter substrate-binding protein [candidate division Zixibacteria bacterium]
MKIQRLFAIAMILFVTVIAGATQAGNIVVIVNPSSGLTEATASDISSVFMGKSSTIGSERVAPIDQSADAQPRIDFSDKILGRTVKKVTDYWAKRVFSGKGEPPTELANDAKVIAHVAETPGAIGYVSAGSLTDAVKALTVDGKKEW